MTKVCAIIIPVKLAFDEVKATQAAALFLKLAARPLNYMALIKLLYKADREAIRSWGLPITTDKYVSMKFGPVTSNIYNRIKDSAIPGSHPTFWAAHIQRARDPLEVIAERDPGNSELSPAEERLIAEVFAADGSKDRFDLAHETHRDFPEWKDPGDSSIPIDISDIIAALELSEEEAARVIGLIGIQRSVFNLAI
ncbi:MAG TPA: Panacea domain-containing protein [Bryobacteraceae bacterium]|nr:Panacea domain-containing protein [Bryobacteraceae bacterium]